MPRTPVKDRAGKNKKKDGLVLYNVRVNYIDITGKYRNVSRRVYGFEEAKELEQALIREVKNTSGSTERMTVQQLFDDFTSVAKHEVRESTLEQYEQKYRLYIAPTMGNIYIDKLSLSVLKDWKQRVEEMPIVRKADEKRELSFATKQHCYSTFRVILNYALKMEYIERNPILKLGNFKDSKATPIKNNSEEYYTKSEFLKYISVAKQLAEEKQAKRNDLSEWDFYVFFSIAFYTGLRKGEINALQWSDICDNMLSVTKSVSQKAKGEDRITLPKNKSSIRDIQMPTPLINALAEHKQRYTQNNQFKESFRICGGLRCLRDTSLDKKNRLYSDRAGLKHIKIHGFRHSHASLLVNAGINIKEVARRLGHSKVEMTWNTYSHLYPREEEKAVEILNNMAENVTEN